MNRMFLALLLFFSASASATITLTAITGASNTPTLGIAGQGVTIFAGLGGTCGGNLNADGTCNTCTACTGTPALCVCNTKQIQNTTPVTIAFVSSFTTVDATHFVAIANATSGTPQGGTSQLYTGPNATQTLNVTWDYLCQAAFGLDCTSVATGQSAGVRVGIWDSNSMVDNVVLTIQVLNPTTVSVDDCSGTSDGTLCKFHAFGGDQSVYMKDPQGNAAYPTNVGAIRFFASNVDFDHADPVNAIATHDFTVSSDGSLSSNIFDGLQNDPATPYYFRSAAVDVAGNVYGFVSDVNIQDPNFGNCATLNSTDPNDGCLYKAFPDQVLGLLTKDLNCFIATASYGSSLEPKLNAFREFRNRFLIGNEVGRNLVMKYYHYGPYAARWIADREWARAVSRAFLWPLWAYSSLANNLGLEVATVVMLMTMVILAALFGVLTAWMVRDSKA